MANYEKQAVVRGKWARGKDLKEKGVKRAKIVSETEPQTGSFEGKERTQNVCRVQFEGQGEAMNVSLNQVSINALVDAYGKSSAAWQGHTLGVEIEKALIGGKYRYPLYLIPKGYVLKADANDYPYIAKEGEVEEADSVVIHEVPEEETPFDDEVPF